MRIGFRYGTVVFLFAVSALALAAFSGCPVTPPGTGDEGEQVQEGETGQPTEGEGEAVHPAEGEATPGKTETIMLPGNVPLEMVRIPAGTFMMGAYVDEQDRWEDEYPQHQVTLTSGFWMAKYELTQAQWKAVMNDNPSWFQGGHGEGEGADAGNRPVEEVSWDDITGSFLPTLNAATGKTFRLPSEAEWEYAARAGTATRFYWGDDPDYTAIGDYAWYYANSDYQTHVVGGKLPNAFGLYDMSGNVWEWVQDWCGPYPSVSDPTGPASGSTRVFRGGSGYNGGGYGCRSAYSNDSYPSAAGDDLGFRLAR